MTKRIFQFAGCTAVSILLVGCGGGPGGSAVRPPNVSPDGAADKAIELYDKNSDGQLSQEELSACPGILANLEKYDANSDGQVSRDEIAARLNAVYGTNDGMMRATFRISKGRQPLSGITVRLVPDPFLEGEVQEGVGTTDDNGYVQVAVPDEKLPESYHGLDRMQIGVYTVAIEGHTPGPDDPPLGFETDTTSRMGEQEVVIDLK